MKKHYRQENDCLNCGAILEGKFCHTCGQENLELKESFGHMMNHAISDYFHFDHQFFHTLKPLLFKPGFLTNEYMAGRRAQYLHPVKMYIFVSIVYFLVLFNSGQRAAKVEAVNPGKQVPNKVMTGAVNKRIANNPNLSAIQKKQIQKKVTKYAGGLVTVTDDDSVSKKQTGLFSTKDTSYQQYFSSQQKLPVNMRDGFLEMQVHKKAIAYQRKYGSRAKEVFFDEFRHNIPKMMFLMLPLFALILKITFSKNRKFYVEHLIYAFHLHCFLFIFLAFIMLVELMLPGNWGIIDWVDLAATCYITWYVFKSLRTVYDRRTFRTITKLVGISVMYFVIFMFCVSTVIVITALISA